MKRAILVLFMAMSLPLIGCATAPRTAQERTPIQKHRDRLVYLVHATAQQAGAYVVSIMWSPDPSDFADFATVTLVYPTSTTEVYVFIREKDAWLLK